MPPRRKPAVHVAVENGDDDVSSDDSEVAPVPRKNRRQGNLFKIPKNPLPDFKGEPKLAEISNALGWNHPEIEYDNNEDLINCQIPPRPDDFTEDPSKGRLMIHKIEVVNFKSYRGKHMLGPFHKNLTMILGPNGSGKSNVIDALLFVFGFRGNKIRSKKLCALIHSTAAMNGQRCKSCHVEIFFHTIKDLNEDKYAIKPGSAFSIGRTAFPDNSSKYTINGEHATQKEVELLLKKSGIDLVHNRFLILQGEVEAIAMMKPKSTSPGEEGMLEYIEDIVGSNRFVPFIYKLEHRIAALEVLVSRQSIKVRVHESTKRALEPAVKHAQRYWNSQNEAAVLKSKLYQCDRYRLNAEKGPLEAEVKDKEAELIEMEENRKRIRAEIREVEAAEAVSNAEVENAQDELDGYIQQIRETEAAEMRRKSNLKKCNNELVRFTKEREDESKLLADTKAIPGKAAKQIEILTQESKDLLEQEEVSLKTASDNLVKFDRKAVDERARKDAFYEDYSKKNAVLNEAKAKVSLAEGELQAIRESSHQNQLKLENFRALLTDAERKYDQFTKEYNQLKKDLPREERALRKAIHELPLVTHREQVLSIKKATMSGRYEDQTAGFQTLLKGTKLHNALMEAKGDGRIPGLLGRLGDLGCVDITYDPAVSTTCAQLDHYVVETSTDAIKAIEILVKDRLPRASFFCMDESIETKRMTRDKSLFPAPRLFDLIHVYEKRIEKIFYHCIGDMLVVPTLADAQKIDQDSRGAWRVVTYEGAVVERTGSMTGGGRPFTGRIERTVNGVLISNTASKASTSTSSRSGSKMAHSKQQDSFKKSRTELEKVTIEHEQVYAQKIRLGNDIETLTARVKEIEDRIKFLEERRPQQVDTINNLKNLIVDQLKLTEESKVDDTEDNAKLEEIEFLKKKQLEAEVIAFAAKAKVDSSLAKIDAMFNELVQKYKDRAQVARERYRNVESEMAKEHASIENAKHNAVTIQKRIDLMDEKMMKKRIEADALSTAEADGKEVHTLHDLARNRRKKVDILVKATKSLRAKRLKLEEKDREQGKQISDQRDLISTLNQSMDELELNLENLSRFVALLKIKKVPTFRRFNNVQIRSNISWANDDDNDDDDENEDDNDNKNDNDGEQEDEIIDSEDEYEEIPILTDEEIEQIPRVEREKMRMNLKAIENFLRENRANTDEKLFEEYSEKAQSYVDEVRTLESYGEDLVAHRKKLAELRAARLEEFSEALAFLGATTQTLYQLITNGGDASLKFVEEGRSSNPFNGGVKFGVRPAKKSWKLIENLSGGEKTLASLCFVFAMHHYRSTPLYVMDEIDAALDTQNVTLIANYIQHSERTRNAQFIIISLRNQMFEVGNRLIGIYKTVDCTHHVVVNPKELRQGSGAMNAILATTKKQKTDQDGDKAQNELSRELERVAIQKIKKPRKPLVHPTLDDFEGGAPAGTISYRNLALEKWRNGPQPIIPTAIRQEEANPFDFEDDDAPVPKRRRRTVCHDDDDDDDEEEEEDNGEEDETEQTRVESNEPSTSIGRGNSNANGSKSRNNRSACRL